MTRPNDLLHTLRDDLEAPVAVRTFGSGWYSGFFALVAAIAGFGLVVALRWPGWFATPELEHYEQALWFRPLVHVVLIASYALALLSLLLRRRKIIGFSALAIGIAAALLGGADVSARETHDWGIFFGVDFFIVNLAATGLMFAPIERFWPHNAKQRLFRFEWREDLFYYLVSSMLVQIATYLALAPSSYINAHSDWFGTFRAAVSAQPWIVQFLEAMVITDFVQYWFHRAFHRVPFLWGFHAVHHSAQAMDWLAGARMHLVEVVLLRGVTSLPLLTFGFSPSVMQAYITMVYIYAGLVRAQSARRFGSLRARAGDAAFPPPASRHRGGSGGREFCDPLSLLGQALRHIPHAAGEMAGRIRDSAEDAAGLFAAAGLSVRE